MRCLLVIGMLVAAIMPAGCSEAIVADGASIIATEKTLADHAISFYKQKNCSSVRKERGLSYCAEDEPNPAPKVHCYPTIGAPDCYADPDPYPGQQEIGQNNRSVRLR